MRAQALRRLRKTGRRRGLTYRIFLASAFSVLLKICTFALLFVAVVALDNAVSATDHSDAALAAAQGLEQDLVDLDASQDGYQLTRDERFLRSWETAQAAFPARAADLSRQANATNTQQRRRAQQIVHDADAYIRDWSIPLVDAARRGDLSSKDAVGRIDDGERRIGVVRAELDAFVGAERKLGTSQKHHFVATGGTAIAAAAVAVLISLFMSIAFADYLRRAIVRPVRHASMMAGELAAGDLTVRMPETAPGEIRTIEHAFNTVTATLEENRDRLLLVAEEQRALRRVATLVARGVAPQEIFDAVAAELGRALTADFAQIVRYEADHATATVVSNWNRPGTPDIMPPFDGHWPIEKGTIAADVLRTGRPSRVSDYENATTRIGVWVRTHGIRCVVGCPVQVEGRTWGSALVYSMEDVPPPELTEHHMMKFVELVGTAIANAQSHTELVASRARLIAASDETRRRIERNLHDGAQQRLVSLGLELRSAQAALPTDETRVHAQLARTIRGLNGVIEELQEIARGLHPAVLSRGIQPALRALARRSAVAVELNVHADGRLPEGVEAAIYYTASEALNNIAKHARATMAHIELTVTDSTLRMSIHDDGVGGADPKHGSGLIGLGDRIQALGGRIEVSSPRGAGTTLLVEVPLGTQAPADPTAPVDPTDQTDAD